MGLKKSLLSGVVAFVVATLVARAVGGKRLGTKIGVLTGGSVALSTWMSGRKGDVTVEIEDEIAAE